MDKKIPMPPAAPTSSVEINEDEIDDQLEGTFPASDPPSWTLGVETTEETSTLNDAEDASRP